MNALTGWASFSLKVQRHVDAISILEYRDMGVFTPIKKVRGYFVT